MTYWVIEVVHALGVSGVAAELFACLLEGKAWPTFGLCGCLCGHQSHSQSAGSLSPTSPSRSMRPLSGLHFTDAVGKAVDLLTKHGLDIEKREEFPVCLCV